MKTILPSANHVPASSISALVEVESAKVESHGRDPEYRERRLVARIHTRRIKYPYKHQCYKSLHLTADWMVNQSINAIAEEVVHRMVNPPNWKGTSRMLCFA